MKDGRTCSGECLKVESKENVLIHFKEEMCGSHRTDIKQDVMDQDEVKPVVTDIKQEIEIQPEQELPMCDNIDSIIESSGIKLEPSFNYCHDVDRKLESSDIKPELSLCHCSDVDFTTETSEIKQESEESPHYGKYFITSSSRKPVN